MKITSGVFAVLALAAFVAWSIFDQRRYEKSREDLVEFRMEEVPLDPDLWAEVQTKWTVEEAPFLEDYSKAATHFGMPFDVKSLVELMNYEMPPYSWILLHRNQEARKKAVAFSMMNPISSDNSIHLSEDRDTALIRMHRTAMIFEDSEEGIVATMRADPDWRPAD